MTGEELRKVLRNQPFQTLTIYLADGRKLRIDHPELLLYAPGARTFVVGYKDGTYEHFDLLLVTSVKVGNGAKRRRRLPK